MADITRHRPPIRIFPPRLRLSFLLVGLTTESHRWLSSNRSLLPSLAVPAYWARLEPPLSSTRKASCGSSCFRFRSSIVGKRLYVGNLTYNVNESDLEAMFAQFGTVRSAQIIVDRETNRSKGFGFVEMDTDAQAQAAIEGLDGQDHDGRRLNVNE